MNGYNEINEARLLLGLPEQASMQDIKASYRKLMARWHPDRCDDDPAACEEMSKKIIAAYEVIAAYCETYRFSFSPDVVLEHATEGDFWLERFGRDSSWGIP